LDQLRELRLQHAYEASSALVSAAFHDDLDADEKLERAQAVLEHYLSFEPGCGGENAYCDAPELRYPVSALGCAVTQAGTSGSRSGAGMLGLLFIALIALGLRARRTGDARALALSLLVLCGLASSSAAQDASEVEARTAAQASSPFALRAALSGSVDEAGAAIAAGGHYRLSPRWLLGLDAEWNPWGSLETGRMRAGAFNTYATVVFRSPVSDSVALRVAAHAGISMLLFDLYGAPSGSVGPYLGLSLLGLEARLGDSLALVLDPADLAIAIPHVTGIPYVRRQYRATIALELSL
jgi:hypothetical protein